MSWSLFWFTMCFYFTSSFSSPVGRRRRPCLGPMMSSFFFDVDGASDPDAEPDEGATDGHAGRLVQRVPQILRYLLRRGGLRTHHRVSASVPVSLAPVREAKINASPRLPPTSAVKKKKPSLLAPLLPLSFIMVYR